MVHYERRRVDRRDSTGYFIMHQPFLLLSDGTPEFFHHSTIPTPVLDLHHLIIHSEMQLSPPHPRKRVAREQIRLGALSCPLTGSSYQRPFTQSPTQTCQDT